MHKSVKRSIPSVNAQQAAIATCIRELRVGREATVRDLARESGVSPAMISEIENGMKSPSLSVLCAIADALEVTLSQLMGQVARSLSIVVLRINEHRVDSGKRDGRRHHDGRHADGSYLQFIRMLLQPGATSGTLHPHAPGCIEHVNVLSGSVHIWAGESKVIAHAGDTVIFPGHLRHGYLNASKTAVGLYVIIDPKGPVFASPA